MNLREIGQKLRHTVARFSAAFASSMLLGVTLTLLLAGRFYMYGSEEARALERVALTLLLAIPFFLANRLYSESTNRRHPLSEWVIAIIGCFLLVGHYFLLAELSDVAMLSYMVTTVVAWLAVLLMPYRSGRHGGFEQYVIKLGLALASTALYSAVLYLGAGAIFITLSELMNIDVGESPLIALIWVACAFSLTHFLSQFPSLNELEEDFGNLSFFRPLLLYLVMPLIVIYMLILYYYLGTILVTQVWPQGVVVHLVLWFSLVVVAVLFLSIPLLEQGRPLVRFRRMLSIFMLPLMAMLFAALAIRINAHGVTEERYYVGLLALWVTGALKYFAFLRRPDGRVLPAVLTVMLIISLFGPLSAMSVAEYSQNNRLEQILLEQGLFKDNQIVPATAPVPWEARVEISRIIQYFFQRQRSEALRHLPADFVLSDMPQVFGFGMILERFVVEAENARSFHLLRDNQFAALPMGDYDYWYSGEAPHRFAELTRPEPSARMNTILRLTIADDVFSIDLAPTILASLKKYPEEQWHALPTEDMDLVFEDERVLMWIIMGEVHGVATLLTGQEPQLDIHMLEFDVFVEAKE